MPPIPHAGDPLRPQAARSQLDLDARAGAQLLHDHLVAIAGHLKKLADPDAILYSGLDQFSTAGTITHSWKAHYLSVFVVNFTVTTIVVAAGPSLGEAPRLGPGVHQIPTGKSHGINMMGRDLTIYGPAGGLVDLQVLCQHIVPSASS